MELTIEREFYRHVGESVIKFGGIFETADIGVHIVYISCFTGMQLIVSYKPLK